MKIGNFFKSNDADKNWVTVKKNEFKSLDKPYFEVVIKLKWS